MKTNANEAACKKLMAVAQAMIDKKISFFEGTREILVIRPYITDISQSDADFNVFLLISSEMDHLPYGEQLGFACYGMSLAVFASS